MKIELDLPQGPYDLLDAVFLAMLKTLRKEAAEDKQGWHEDDEKMDKEIIKACDVLIAYFSCETK